MSDAETAAQKSASMSSARFRIIESYVWAIVATAIAGRVLFFSIRYPSDSAMIFREFYWDVVIAGLVFIFPIVFRLIFGLLPLEFLRVTRTRANSLPTIVNVQAAQVAIPSSGEPSPLPIEQSLEASDASVPAGLLLRYATSSRQLAAGIYGRAGVYLLVGVLVAFSGLVFFYTQTGTSVTSAEAGTLLLNLAPKFGILFFIEFVAFFFLRQYRSAMDEFRYYEAVARTREEVVALFHIAHESGATVQPMELIKHESFFSKGTVLSKGQSSEILEARKMERSEIELLEKIVDTLAKAKK